MNRRQILAGTAALPAAALPIPALAITANGTDAAWHALVAADAKHGAVYLALDDARQAIWTAPAEPPTAALPRLTGDGEPFQLTLAELRDARKTDSMFRGPDEAMEGTLREMLDRQLKLRQMRTPEAIAERRALYDRLEAELVEQGEAARPPKPAHIARLEAEVAAAEKRASDAEDALFVAPVLTVEDAIRKLQHAHDRHMDPEDYNAMLVTSALDGLRRIAAAERLA